jgi:twitching motility two-component system response regulator PilG
MNPLIMVIDDSTTVRKILAASLRREGYEVISFADGIEAIRWLTYPQSRLPALLILDVGLPKMSGYDIARSFKKKPALAHIIIVMLSGHTSVLDHLKGRLSGAQHYLTKPFKTQDIVAVVEAHLGPVLFPLPSAYEERM